MAITPNTNFVSGAVLTAQQQNNFGRGLMNYTGNITGATALNTVAADITGMSLSWTAETGRLYRITWTISGVKNTSAGYVEVALTTNANANVQAIDTNAIAGGFWNLSGMGLVTTTSGVVTYKLRGLVQNDTATITAQTGAPISMIVEDVGHT